MKLVCTNGDCPVEDFNNSSGNEMCPECGKIGRPANELSRSTADKAAELGADLLMPYESLTYGESTQRLQDSAVAQVLATEASKYAIWAAYGPHMGETPRRGNATGSCVVVLPCI